MDLDKLPGNRSCCLQSPFTVSHSGSLASYISQCLPTHYSVSAWGENAFPWVCLNRVHQNRFSIISPKKMPANLFIPTCIWHKLWLFPSSSGAVLLMHTLSMAPQVSRASSLKIRSMKKLKHLGLGIFLYILWININWCTFNICVHFDLLSILFGGYYKIYSPWLMCISIGTPKKIEPFFFTILVAFDFSWRNNLLGGCYICI